MFNSDIFGPGTVVLIGLGLADLMGLLPSWLGFLICISVLFAWSFPFLIGSRR